jgi:iron complex outermembrane recepter protein
MRATALLSAGLVLAGTASVSTAQTTPAADPPAADQQTAAAGESDRLQTVVVTAERRTEPLQSVPATIQVLDGPTLSQQGRISVQQMLEDLPDVGYGFPQPGQSPDTPYNVGNLSIRGIQATQSTGGTPAPPVVAVYVDGVFEGIGGDYDLNRVEVLYGPQGTLYGRSATAGVIAFHTNDPVLGKFGTDISAELGSDRLRNGTAVVNLPLGDRLALRVAAHEVQTQGYRWNPAGGATDTTEGRAKLLYQPLDRLTLEVSASTAAVQTYAGGPQQELIAPGVINYDAGSNPVKAVAADQFNQFAGTLKYDFGPATLTYEGSAHSYHQNGFQGQVGPPFMPIYNYGTTKPDSSDMQEVRLASNPGGRLTWLVGANYYSHSYSTNQTSIVQSANQCGPCGIPDTTSGVDGGEIFENGFIGKEKDYAAFTQETYALTDALNLTVGLRYDHEQVRQETFYDFNVNLDQYGQSVGTCADLMAVSGTPLPCVHSSALGDLTFNNLTYKAGLKYDLTPANLVYGTVSTGYLPGDVQLSAQPQANGSVNFVTLPYSQQRLTSFEVGSKNRFLDNRLQLNGDLFYYNYQGWEELADIGNTVGGAPIGVVVSAPLRVIGAELNAILLLTPADRITVNAGYYNDEITSWPTVPGTGHTANYYLIYKRIPGPGPASGMASYQHMFAFDNGATLVPRVEVRWEGGNQIVELARQQLIGYPALGAEDYQSSYAVMYADLAWVSPQGTYGLTLYGRNLANREAGLYGNVNQGFLSTVPLEPRTYGVSFSARF